MSTFHPGMTVEEQKVFLTETRLYLAREIRRTRWKEGVFSLRHMPTGKYLRVSAEGLYILGCFGRGTTVAEVVTELVKTRRCPPFRTLYAFIVEARARNILLESPDAVFPKVTIPGRWPSLAPTPVGWMIGTAVGAGILAVLFQPWPMPDVGAMTGSRPGDVLAAYVMLSFSATVGSLLASMTVLRLGGEVRAPKFVWRTWLPRLVFDWTDTEIGGPKAIRAAALLRLAPTAWLAFACALIPALRPVAAFVSCGMLLRCGPVSDPVRRWLQANWRNPLNRDAARRWFFRSRSAEFRDRLADLWDHDSRYAVRLLVLCGCWSAAIIALMGRMVDGSALSVFRVMGSIGSATFLGLLVAVFSTLSAGAYFLISSRNGKDRVAVPERRQPSGPPPSARTLFDRAPLFRALPSEVTDDLALGCRVLAVPPGAGVVGLGESGEELYVVRTGEFEVVSRSEKTGDAIVMRLKPGDVFGELSHFGDLLRPCNVRAIGPGELFIVVSPDVHQTLMRHLSLPVIEEITQRRTFLRTLSLLDGCNRRTVEDVVRLVRFDIVPEGRLIGASGRENRHYSFVFTGCFDAQYKERKKDRLRPGASFGEVSMLVGEGDDEFEAVEPSRRLVIGKDDFIPLLGRDPGLALRLEETAAWRIGRPVFPYKPANP